MTVPANCPTPWRVRGSVATALVTCAALVLAACGGGSAKGSAATSTTGAAPTAPTAPPASGTLEFGPPSALTHGPGLVAVSCAGSVSCIAFDAAGHAYFFDGTGWTGPTVVGSQAIGPGTISVSCATATLCMAAPTGGNQVAAWIGQSWSAPITLTGSKGIDAVGCAPTGYCAAVDAQGNAFAYDGQEWRPTSGDWGSVSAISCVDATFCMSVSGGISQWGGSKWTTPDTLGVPWAFTGISCPAASFCVAVNGHGQALTWNGQAWSTPTVVDPGTASTSPGIALTGISCPTVTYCVASGADGGLVQWADGTWSRTGPVAKHPISAVSCSSTTFCVAVDRAGNVVVGRPR